MMIGKKKSLRALAGTMVELVAKSDSSYLVSVVYTYLCVWVTLSPMVVAVDLLTSSLSSSMSSFWTTSPISTSD